MARRDVTAEIQDLTRLSWSERASSSGTAGTYLKAREGSGTRMTYYKLSRYNGRTIDGCECVNEVVASRLMDVLGIGHVRYRLVHARVVVEGVEHVTWLNASRNFRRSGERKVSLGTYYGLYRHDDESPYDFCARLGWQDEVRKVMLVDYLMANRDRHSSNIEVLVDRRGEARLAPLFDTGLSLFAPFAWDEERVRAFDPLAEVATTNFVGSRSLEKNLGLVGRLGDVTDLTERDRAALLDGLEGALEPYQLDKVWEIVWERWRHYEDVRDR
ncbi:hypothetical protein [Thermophilibacter sp.]